MAAAETQYRAVLGARPASAQVRVRLAEALLNQCRYDEAAGESTQIDDGETTLGWQRGSSCGAGSPPVTSRARPQPTSAPPGWASRPPSARCSPPGSSSPTAQQTSPDASPWRRTPLLGVILETLLRAHDFEAFERLIPLLRASALPEREQREQLASMYLAQGFLPQAAQEWMAVCHSRPDARALLGLARVAERHGQLEDAAVFAGETLQHDPANAPAREILARCGPEVALSA